MGKAEKTWISLGEADPYFGVLTDDRFTRKNIAENLEAFKQSGDAYVDSLMADIAAHFDAPTHARALDFGCGVGRLAIPLSRYFNEVVGLDISPAMLGEARKLAGDNPKVTFALSDDDLGNAPGEFDLVHSYIVLQHIPVDKGLKILRAMLARVAIGGIASLHFPVSRDGGTLERWRYWARCNVPGAHRLSNLMRGRPISEPMMQMNAYPLPTIFSLFEEFGFERSISALERHFNVLTIRVTAQRRDAQIWTA